MGVLRTHCAAASKDNEGGDASGSQCVMAVEAEAGCLLLEKGHVIREGHGVTDETRSGRKHGCVRGVSESLRFPSSTRKGFQGRGFIRSFTQNRSDVIFILENNFYKTAKPANGCVSAEGGM